jgi:tetratricopeptide (TPR) repeat protein
MNRFSRVVLICMLLSGIRPLAQEPQSSSGSQQPNAVTPPSPTASAEDLEKEGDALRARKEYLDALDYYHAAMKKSDSATLHNKAGIALLQMNRYPEARKEFQQALKMDKDYADAHNNLGATYYQLRRFGSAAGEYRKAVKLNDLKASFHSNLGIAYFAMKDLDRGAKEYARALELDPHIFDPQASGGVSIKLAATGDRAAINYVLAKMFGQRGDAERCRLYLSKANEEGYPRVKDALKDNEFAELRKDPEFVNFVRSLKPPQQPENASN